MLAQPGGQCASQDATFAQPGLDFLLNVSLRSLRKIKMGKSLEKPTYELTWSRINATLPFFPPSERDSHLKLLRRSNFRRLFVIGPMCASRAAPTGCLPDPVSRSLAQSAEATGEKRLERLSLWIPAGRRGVNTLSPLSRNNHDHG